VVSTTAQPKFGDFTDPADFVTLAERATNAYDTELATALYSEDAEVEVIADGARERVVGRAAIREALARFTGPLKDSGYAVEKKLLSAEPGLIVNEWTGRFPGSDRSVGIEIWRFDADGKVNAHRLFAFFDVRGVNSPIAGARLALGKPLLALRLLRARFRTPAV
jgi:hypothetical protein